MADYINNVATEDEYTDALTIGPDFQTDTLTLTVANNAALMQFAVGRPGEWRWQDEREFLSPPQSFTISRVIGARFRSAQAGEPARILAILGGIADPLIGAGLAFTSTLSPSGGISSAVVIPTVALDAFPPANPQDGQACLLVLPASYDPIGGEPVRWLCTYDASSAMWQVAGAALQDEIAAKETAASAAYGDLATVGPALPIPRPGDYDVEAAAQINSFAVTNIEGFMAYTGAGIAASDNDAAIASSPNGGRASVSQRKRKTGLVVGTITAKYRAATANDAQFGNRRLTVTPIRIT